MRDGHYITTDSVIATESVCTATISDESYNRWLMKNIEMDLSHTADSNDYFHANNSLQFKRERRKVSSNKLLYNSNS